MPFYWFDNAIQLPNGIMCYRHRTMFVGFDGWRQPRMCKGGGNVPGSRGCPVCVGLIRAEVQRDIAWASPGRSGATHTERIKAGQRG